MENENRLINEEWELDFYMAKSGSSMMCLRCKLQIKTLKRSNAKQHYENCKSQAKYITLQDAARKQAFDMMNCNHGRESAMFSKFKSTTHSPEIEATYRVAFLLGAAGKPYVDVELVKECLCEVVRCLEPSQLHKYRNLSLSRRTLVRRQEELAIDIAQQLDKVCKQSDLLFSLALDKSCDAMDTA